MREKSCMGNKEVIDHFQAWMHYYAKGRPQISCTMQQPVQNNIKVIINGTAKEIGRAAVIAVTRARGMEVTGVVDNYCIGEDIGKNLVYGLEKLM